MWSTTFPLHALWHEHTDCKPATIVYASCISSLKALASPSLLYQNQSWTFGKWMNCIAVSLSFRIADNILYQRSPSSLHLTLQKVESRQSLMFTVYWHISSDRFVEIFVECLCQVSKSPCCYWMWDWSSVFPFTLWPLDYISADGKDKGIHLLCIFCRIDDFFSVSLRGLQTRNYTSPSCTPSVPSLKARTLLRTLVRFFSHPITICFDQVCSWHVFLVYGRVHLLRELETLGNYYQAQETLENGYEREESRLWGDCQEMIQR